jgi:hypothetical protein
MNATSLATGSVDVEGIDDFGPHEHINDDGICEVCGAWLPEARCRVETCGWSSPRGPDTLAAAVEHRVDTGHPVRVYVG